MVQNVNNINQTAFRSYAAKTNSVTNPMDNSPREFNPDFYVNKKEADAIKSYNFVAPTIANPFEITEPVSVQEYKNRLTKIGLVENRDFTVENNDKMTEIIIDNPKTGSLRRLFWEGGQDKEHFDGYFDSFVPKSGGEVAALEVQYDNNGYLEWRSVTLNNPEKNKNLFPRFIDINTTADEYAKNLEKNDTKYDIQKSVEESGRTVILEYNSDNTVEKMTSFYEDDNAKIITQLNTPDKDGNLRNEFELCQDKTSGKNELTISNNVIGLGIKNDIKY